MTVIVRLLGAYTWLLPVVGLSALAERVDIPPYTPGLAAKLEVHPFPLIATYRRGNLQLVFAAGGHVFTDRSRRIATITKAFNTLKPAIVILEGFPTAMGENPPPLVAEAKMHAKANRDAYAAGEAMFSAALAFNNKTPFIGGEPTTVQQKQALIRAGYLPKDILFTFVLLDISQALRAGHVARVDTPEFQNFFDSTSRSNARALGVVPISLSEFSLRYRAIFNADFRRDTQITKRVDPGTSTLVGKLFQIDMIVRDKHIFATIMDELAAKKTRVGRLWR